MEKDQEELGNLHQPPASGRASVALPFFGLSQPREAGIVTAAIIYHDQNLSGFMIKF
jgi:hypothetical protein